MEALAAHGGFDFTLFFWLMVIASLVAMAGRYIRIPYALALVITGLIVAPLHILPQVFLEPHILFTIFLPPLLFESAINMRISLLRENWKPISIYALAGTLLSTVTVGVLVSFLLDLPLAVGLVFGALISPTDPISVIAIFKELGVGKRLSLIMEAESLFNDGVAVVLFTLLVGVAAGQEASLAQGIQSFLIVVLGGAVLGAGIGFAASRLTRYFDDHLFEIMLTTVVAFGSFLSAETLGVSGVIAVVFAGLVVGSYGMHTGMSPTTRLSVTSFWEYAAFVVNSIVFLMVGLEVSFVHIYDQLHLILIAALIVLAGRAAAIYGLSPLANLAHSRVPRQWQHVLFWGGLRGAIPMALVLGLGRDFPARDDLLVITFGVVLFSLLFQGLTMKGLLSRLGLIGAQQGAQVEYGRLASRLVALEVAQTELDALKRRKALSDQAYQSLREEYRQEMERLEKEMKHLHISDEELEQEQIREARRLALLAEKSTLREAERNGLLDEEGLHHLIMQIDQKLHRL